MICGYFSVALFLGMFLHYEFLRSDVLSYWQESINWSVPFNEHPPLYALTIALIRTLTLNTIPPIVLMMGINLICFCCCTLLIVQFIQAAGIKPIYASAGALLFGLWPLVGLTYTVLPQADIPAIVLTLAGLVMIQKQRTPIAALLFGLAIITHKGVWPIIGFVIIADFYLRREFLSRKNLVFLLIMLFPLATLWIAGSFYHHSVNWLMERSMRVNTSVGGGYPILDGLFLNLREGGIKGLVKASIVLFFLSLSLVSLIASLKLKFKYYELCSAIAGAILIMLLFSSAGTIWGPIRFSKFLVIPLIFIANSYLEQRKAGRTIKAQVVVLFVGLFISQFVYAWYIADVFFA